MKEDIKKVFFLGAGFSKAINKSYPLMKDLSLLVKDKIGQFKPVLDTYYDTEIADAMKNNIENLLTYLSSNFPFKNDVQQAMNVALYKAIVKILSDFFIEKSSECFADEVWFRKLDSFADFVVNNNVNIITLNYDVLLESIIETAFLRNEFDIDIHECYKYPFVWMGHRYRMTSKTEIHEDEFFKCNSRTIPFPIERQNKILSILKLHGSANWFWGGINPTDPIYYKNWSFDTTKEIDYGLIPYIIPPVLDKNSFYNHIALKYLWGEAHKLLENADEIYIVGFSFPQTDLAVRFLFQSALRKSSAQIYVINSASRDKLKENYEQAFGERKLHYDYTDSEDALQEFIKDKLEEISYRNEQL